MIHRKYVYFGKTYYSDDFEMYNNNNNNDVTQ